MDKSGGAFVSNGNVTQLLESLFNKNCIFKYETQLVPLDYPYAVKRFSHQPWLFSSSEDMMLQKNIKGEWVVLYGVKVSTPYGIDE